MPIRSMDPFYDHLQNLRPEVNRYVSLMREAATLELPLLQGPGLKPWTGRWQEHFSERMKQSPERLVLEIGSHFGEVILKMAENNPSTAFVGMDITLKRVVKLAEHAQSQGLTNLTSILANARGLESYFSNGELDGAIVFFPDPWAKKKKHLKNRLLTADFLRLLQRKLRPDGFFWFKTDCEPYFAEACEALSEQGWRILDQVPPLGAPDYTSRFERHFRDKGLPTYARVFAPPLQA